jgi:hypothetical protein
LVVALPLLGLAADPFTRCAPGMVVRAVPLPVRCLNCGGCESLATWSLIVATVALLVAGTALYITWREHREIRTSGLLNRCHGWNDERTQNRTMSPAGGASGTTNRPISRALVRYPQPDSNRRSPA